MNSRSEHTLLARIEPWSSLWETEAEGAAAPRREPHGKATAAPPKATPPPAPSDPPDVPERKISLSREGNRLACDVLTYPFDQCTPRCQRLDLSGREFVRARAELEQKILIRVISIGRALYLVPMFDLYAKFGQDPPPQKRSLSLEHSFAVQLAAYLVRHQPLVSRVDTEVPVGSSGATVDLVAHTRDGARIAYEITLSLGNVVSNAAKCRDKGFAEIVFLCRNTQIKQGAWAQLREAGLPPELYGRCRVVLFSKLTARKKALHGE